MRHLRLIQRLINVVKLDVFYWKVIVSLYYKLLNDVCMYDSLASKSFGLTDGSIYCGCCVVLCCVHGFFKYKQTTAL